MTLITIGPVQIHGARQADGFWLEADGLKGWHDGITYRRNLIPRPGQHGYFDQAPFLDGRTVTLSGFCRADTVGKLDYYRALLSGLAANGNLTKLAVQDDTQTLFGYARIDAGMQWTLRRASLLAKWQTQFWLPNPRKYGSRNVFTDAKTGNGTSAGVTLFHRGTFPASPRCTVTGTMPAGYTLNGPSGRHFVVTRALAAAETHVVDMEDGTLEVNGSLVYGGTADVDLWTVRPGAQVATTFTGNGSATVVTTLRDTYL